MFYLKEEQNFLIAVVSVTGSASYFIVRKRNRKKIELLMKSLSS